MKIFKLNPIFETLFLIFIAAGAHAQQSTVGAAAKFKVDHGPYLQHVSDTGATFVWVTNRNGIGWVELAPDDSSNFYKQERKKIFDSKDGLRKVSRIHTVTLNQLMPGTRYRYRIFSQEVLSHEGIEKEEKPVPRFSRKITSVTSLVRAGAAICLEGTKASMLLTTFACGTLMVSGTLNLWLMGCPFVNSSVLRKGTASVDGNSSIADVRSHLDMAPENRLCMLRSLALGIDGVSPLRKALPALAAIPKFMDLMVIAGEWAIWVLFTRTQWVPMRR